MYRTRQNFRALFPCNLPAKECHYVLPSHQLPHQRQSQGRIAIVQVLPANANEGELG